ncbi:Malonate-semialdehyde dehydrogenase 2 [Candidatus Desulfarcum epimagneticum]|uniref:methylmalonate-semialdehyde dehydrogenase (CoA acylating) n=1 Tax=uncultured Desulfobacteraceae bacterium TaxID=218296 RepID=A0A484HHR9_9BACT|nr:Malonate-semialdehyde dehydrogenase 2 [uncultured Desulfobacteraceae bacterium]
MPTTTIPTVKNYINGQWVESKAREFSDVWNPAKGEKIARTPLGVREDLDMAVKAAREAFPAWRVTPPLSRARYLFRLKEAFEDCFEDIARAITTEQGKIIDESRGEVRRMIENVEHATGVTTMMTGDALEDIAQGIDCYTHRQPMGVFAAIAPYNFPGMVPWWFLPYALVSGNAFIVKPSEQVPMTQCRIFEVIDDIGFPEGVVNMVHGAHEIVNAILDHPDIEGVSFVGSTATARHVYERCGASGKRVQALGGAKNIVAVTPDARVEAGIPSLVSSFYGCAGQRCLAASVLVPIGEAADETVEKFTAFAKTIRPGNGLDETTGMGPLAGAAHKQRVLDYIEKGIEEGAKLILDGRDCRVEGFPDGFFVGPTVFDHADPDMAISQEEIFGPVTVIIRAKDLSEAIDIVNTRKYANAACLYTQSGAAAREFKYKVKPSMVGINIGVAAPMSFFPFGGAGNSMFGDIKGHGREIFHFFTDAKVVMERWF